MTAHRSTEGDSQDESLEERLARDRASAEEYRTWAEFEVEMMEKYRYLPLEQFTAIVSHEILLKIDEDSLLFWLGGSLGAESYEISPHGRAKKEAEHLWRQCQPKPSAESTAEIEKLYAEIEKLYAEIEKLRNEVKLTNESTDKGWGSVIGLTLFLVIFVLIPYLLYIEFTRPLSVDMEDMLHREGDTYILVSKTSFFNTVVIERKTSLDSCEAARMIIVKDHIDRRTPIPNMYCTRTLRWWRERYWPGFSRPLRSACVHAAFSSTPCESALSSSASQSTKRQ